MDCARGLASAENIDQGGESGIDARRHGQACQDHQRQEDDNDRQIGELLKRVVMPRLLAFGEAETSVVENLAAEMARREFVHLRRQVSAEVSAQQAKAKV